MQKKVITAAKYERDGIIVSHGESLFDSMVNAFGGMDNFAESFIHCQLLRAKAECRLETGHDMAHGNVYFVSDGERVKIGHTTKPVKQRLRQLSIIGKPLKLW